LPQGGSDEGSWRDPESIPLRGAGNRDARAAAKLTASVARGAKWNAPLWVGEFDMIGGGNAQETEAMLKAFRENRVGWAYWAYSRASKPLRDGARLRTDRVQVLQQGF
jgi:hypothetical protein